MKSVVAERTSSKNLYGTSHTRPTQAKIDWVTLGLTGATLAGHAGGMIHGYPMLNVMRYGDTLMFLSLMGVGLTVVSVICTMVIVGLKRKDEEDSEEDEYVEPRPRWR
eukprot:Gregarina_sp_Poly_1__130@NODE_102_length_14381_cov_59_883820_g89_i0_p14_GENE_NODE_102_length_14381_cov_59_883820_g89_i0NODE_102_length_14381_cov_59_883820_g89_i0_p14_ORF_typecomplete_len108_score9_15Formdeh_trans/PF09163_11/5e03Formdeh_trans/PF09163_11/0_15DUF1593/PF07632_11/0_14COX14/PF14880_6/4_7e02COX14/PF14880_6/0_83_NODE_102_length_14381_cov_59_883820_g89_i01264412967